MAGGTAIAQRQRDAYGGRPRMEMHACDELKHLDAARLAHGALTSHGRAQRSIFLELDALDDRRQRPA
jgi:hypothetical protein